MKEDYVKLGVALGVLADTFIRSVNDIEALSLHVSKAICILIKICISSGICILQVVENKIEVNERKYNLSSVCRDKEVFKYPRYSSVSHIHSDKDYTVVNSSCFVACSMYGQSIETMFKCFGRKFKDISQKVKNFAEVRGWLNEKVYSGPNLCVGLFSEFGELARVIEWKPDELIIADDILEGVGRECADIMIYLLHICRVKGIDMDHGISLVDV